MRLSQKKLYINQMQNISLIRSSANLAQLDLSFAVMWAAGVVRAGCVALLLLPPSLQYRECIHYWSDGTCSTLFTEIYYLPSPSQPLNRNPPGQPCLNSPMRCRIVIENINISRWSCFSSLDFSSQRWSNARTVGLQGDRGPPMVRQSRNKTNCQTGEWRHAMSVV